MTAEALRGGDGGQIVVGCAADRNYVMPLAVMLASLVDHLHEERSLCVYVVDGGIPAEDRSRLSAMLAGDRVELRWVAGGSASLPRLLAWGRLSTSVYERLLLPDLLPESVAKAIWLDCDLVVRHDVAQLWDAELGDRPALAVQDMIVPYVSSPMGIAHHAVLGLPASAKYFNAGVMVVNLARWREEHVAAHVLAYLDRFRNDVFFLEQEGLNAVFAGRWGELDPRWNQNAGVAGRSFYKPPHLDEAGYRRVVDDPWIVHFTGNLKPWNIAHDDPLRALYFRYLDMTPWAGWRPRRTVAGSLVGMYESSRLRKLVYPAERWGLGLVRRTTRRRTSALAGESDAEQARVVR